mgnify:CR=1 FL=1
MDNFKKTLKKRFIAYITLSALLFTVNVVLVILNALEILKPIATSMGTVYGASMGACVVLLKYAINAKTALKDEKKFEKLYIRNTDERMLFIEKSTSNLATNIFLCCLCFYMYITNSHVPNPTNRELFLRISTKLFTIRYSTC